MPRRALLLTIVLGIAFAADFASAEGPLRKRFSGGSNVPIAGRSVNGWKMPGGRLVQGTQSAMAGARDRLAFWRNRETSDSNEFIEGTGRFFRPDLAQREEENSRPFSFVRPATWFEPVEEPAPGPQSVHDWIGQPRVGFE